MNRLFVCTIQMKNTPLQLSSITKNMPCFSFFFSVCVCVCDENKENKIKLNIICFLLNYAVQFILHELFSKFIIRSLNSVFFVKCLNTFQIFSYS